MAKQKDNVIRVEGVIEEALPNAMFKVRIETDDVIIGYISGKMRMHYIRLLQGDRVTLELSPYDLSRGRIILRHKKDIKETS